MEVLTDFIWGGSRITADSDHSKESKRCFFLGRKAMTKLDSILKSRDITLLTKACILKPLVYPLVKYGCESWIIKKTEHQTIDAFGLWCWKILWRFFWTARSNQTILKEINPEYSLEGQILKLHYFEHLMWRVDTLEKTWLTTKQHQQKWEIYKFQKTSETIHKILHLTWNI